MFDLVQTTTKDKVILHGLQIQGDKNKPVILHIHGFEEITKGEIVGSTKVFMKKELS